jgi:hypothetical protein
MLRERGIGGVDEREGGDGEMRIVLDISVSRPFGIVSP